MIVTSNENMEGDLIEVKISISFLQPWKKSSKELEHNEEMLGRKEGGKHFW